MSLGFVQTHPLWFVLLCLILSLVYAALLYYKNKSNGFSTGLTLRLSSEWFLVVSLLAFILLSPLLLKLIRYLEVPLIIFALDQSQSIISGADSIYYQYEFQNEKERFFKVLDSIFNVRNYQFGETFRESETQGFNDRLTNISNIFAGIEKLYSNRNVGAVIVASDGIFNRGSNPVLLASGFSYPVYTLALGDTLPKPDMVVKRLNHNRIAYMGNQFPLEVEVEARQMHGKTTRMLLRRGNETLQERSLKFRTNHHFETLLLELQSDRPGMQRYSVELVPAGGEENTKNNRQEFYIEVIDSRQKVLLLANNLHPDLCSIKMALDENDNYEVNFSLINDFAGQVEGYNLVILHQLPSATFSVANIMQRLGRSQVPALFIVGAQTSITAFNQARTGLIITPRSVGFVETQPSINPSFSLFSPGPESIEIIKHLPPLHSPFAVYQASAGAHILLYQKIGTAITDQPLLLFSVAGTQKSGVIAGEGIWRWRLNDFLRNRSHKAIYNLIWRMVQYVSVKEDKNLFRVRADHFVYKTDNRVFDAELYNPGFGLVNEPAVQLVITNQTGVRYNYEMGQTTNAYRLIAGSFSPGDYTLEASTSLGGVFHKASGKFSVAALNIENLNTIADHNLLHQMADLSGGKMIFKGQWEQLAQSINERDDLRPIMYSQKEFYVLINLKAVFALLLLLLAAEWFLRKWKSSY